MRMMMMWSGLDIFFCFKQKTAYEMRSSDWSSDVCSSDLADFLSRVGVTLANAIAARPSLDGSLLRLVSVGQDRWWQFHHPSFTDAYQLWLSGHPELLAEFVASAQLEELVRTVTCGDVGLEGALVVPGSMYGADRKSTRLNSSH